jgi:hypothetical protein
MASGNDNSLGNKPIIIIIGLIAACIGIFTFVTPWQSIWEMFSTDQGMPTQKAAQIDESPTVRIESSTTIPSTLTSPTITPIPLPTSVPDTSPGTILEVGQAWQQGSLELRLTGSDMWPETILAYFTLTNIGGTQRVIQYSQDNFTAVDNLSRRIDTGGIYWYFEPSVQHTCSSRTVILNASDSNNIKLKCEWGNFAGIALAVDVTDSAITEIVISVSEISTINNARWRIPIHH